MPARARAAIDPGKLGVRRAQTRRLASCGDKAVDRYVAADTDAGRTNAHGVEINGQAALLYLYGPLPEKPEIGPIRETAAAFA